MKACIQVIVGAWGGCARRDTSSMPVIRRNSRLMAAQKTNHRLAGPQGAGQAGGEWRKGGIDMA
ncbi:hypothetical protein JCM12296A_42600 [Desulfosarcina cetonica]